MFKYYLKRTHLTKKCWSRFEVYQLREPRIQSDLKHTNYEFRIDSPFLPCCFYYIIWYIDVFNKNVIILILHWSTTYAFLIRNYSRNTDKLHNKSFCRKLAVNWFSNQHFLFELNIEESFDFQPFLLYYQYSEIIPCIRLSEAKDHLISPV